MSASFGLDDLPNELLAAVIDALPKHGRSGIRNLYNLCLVSKRFNTLTQPLLYHKIDDTNFDDVRPLISTLIRKIDLAKCVREVKMESFEVRDADRAPSWPWQGNFSPETIKQYKQECSAAVKDLQISFQDRWDEDIERGIQDAYNALLLCLIPNLEILQLKVPQCFYFENTIVHRVLNEAVSRPPYASKVHGFKKLRDLHLEHADTEGGFSLRRLSSIFHLQQLQRLTMHAWGEVDAVTVTDATGDWPERTSPIKHIDIQWSDTPASNVKDLLSFVKTLETFRYEAGGSTAGDTMYYLPDFNDALSLHSSSLTQLELRFEESFWFEFKEETSPPLGSLSAFTALKVLRLDAACLTGIPEDGDEDEESDEEGSSIDLINLLPPNIERFRVFTPIPIEPIEQLLETAPEKFPSLRQIGIEDWATREDYRYLQEMADNVSIDVILRGNVCISLTFPLTMSTTLKRPRPGSW